MIELKSKGGNYPYQLAPYWPAEIRATLQIEGDQIRIRIDDLRNCTRWEKLVGDSRELLAALLNQKAGNMDQGNTALDLAAEKRPSPRNLLEE